MHALASKRLSRILTLIVSALVLAGCGKGDGPEAIAGTPATALPPIPPGLCDSIGFEVLCALPGIENFNGGATTVIDNPDMSGINGSEKVAQMQKFADEVFGGTKLNLSEAIDFSAGEFYKVKVWSPRPVVVSFKLEETGNPGGGLTKDVPHPGGSNWQELCFDFTGQTVPPPVTALTIIFDLGVLGQAAVDPNNWTFYYDEIEQATSCAGAGGGGMSIDPDSTLYSTAGNPDLVVPDDYSEVTPFGSESVIDTLYADDSIYSPVIAVASGTGYSANVAQIGYIGFPAGFAGAYETLDFKVKGMPNQVIFVKLFDDVDALRINLTSSAYSGALGDGWFQVSILIADFAGVDQATGIVFESDNAAAMQFTMLLTDIGFSGTGTGGPVTADPGITPEFVVYATDPGVTEDLAPPGGIQNFGSGAAFDGAFAGDADFNPALQVISGEGYGAGAHVGFAAFTGYAAGFAATYETLLFKVKGDAANLTAFEVKFFGPDDSQVYDLTTYAGSTDLGNGWYQVSIPVSDFNAANIGGYDGFLLGPLGAQAAPFSILMTDIGFSGTTGGGSGITPEFVVYATDPGVTEDLAPPGGIQDFSSGAVFDAAFAGDADYNPALQATSGEGYGAGAHTAFTAFTGYAPGFAATYETLEFKAKGDAANLVQFEAKFFAPDDSQIYDLTTYGGSTDLGNGWYQVSIPMSDFNAANIGGYDGFLLGPFGAQAAPFSFLMTDIGFSGTGGGGGGPVGDGSFVNGDFESGDFTGWTETPDGGSITLDTTGQGGRAGNVARLVATGAVAAGAQDVLLSQVNLTEINSVPISGSDSVTVSVDVFGSLSGAGGVVFIELISRDSGGNETGRSFIGPAPITPTTTWTSYSATVNVAADVSGGITLQLKSSCGPVDGCGVDASFDNVSIVIN
jgi:hypothetical protein